MKLILPFLLFSLQSFAQLTIIEDMIEGRNAHTASTVMMNGNTPGALICGGYDGSQALQSAEWYNAATDNWSSLGDMESTRMDHAATAYNDGDYVLITGGFNGFSENLNSTEIFNATDGTFEMGPAMSYGRSFHSSTLLEDVNGTDYILVCGGFDGFEELAACERLNLSTMQWESAGTMNLGRSSFSIARLDDGKYLLAGGFNANAGFQLSACEIYDPIANSWTLAAFMEHSRDNHASVELYDGKILVAGGRRYNGDLNLFEGMIECEYYDAIADEWTEAPDLLAPQSYCQMLYSLDSYYLLAGGVDHTGQDVETTTTPSIEYFHPFTFWFTVELLYPEGRYKYAMTRLPDGILVCGGEDGDPSGELYTGYLDQEEKEVELPLIFPNPCKDILRFATDQPMSCTLQEMGGKTVFSGRVGISGSLDLSQLAEGVYTVQTTDFQGKQSLQKLVLSR